jgi:hypothetical protein
MTPFFGDLHCVLTSPLVAPQPLEQLPSSRSSSVPLNPAGSEMANKGTGLLDAIKFEENNLMGVLKYKLTSLEPYSIVSCRVAR